jgi:hypothetical protein
MAGKTEAEGFKSLLTGGLPDLGPGPRAGIMSQEELDKVLGLLLGDTDLPAVSQKLVRGVALLWHDHLDAAHTIAQDIESADGSYLHGIVHRREPDYGNAKYWFRRVGRHAAFPIIVERVVGLLEPKHEHLLQKELMPDGAWDAFAFIDLCERAAGRAADKGPVEKLKQVQAVEFEVLLEHVLTAL